ncbi:MAG: hypothetical protein AABZ61_02405 [Bacteroidota bacterium]
MKQLLTVLGYKLWAAMKGVFGFRRSEVTREVASFLVLAGFSVAIFFFARFITSYLINEAHIGLFLFHRFLSMVLFVFFLAVNLGNMIVAYSTLYKSDEVDFLLSQPISFEKVFIIKFLDNFFRRSTTLFLVGTSVLAGYGSVFGMHWTFYLFVMAGLVIPFMLLAATLAVIILLVLMKLAITVNVRRLIAGLLLGYFASVYLYFRVTNPEQLTEEVMKFYPNVNEYFSQFDPKLITYLPNHWLADSLYFLVRGDFSAAVPYVEVMVLTTIASVIVCLLVAIRLYYFTWLASRELRIQKASNKSQPAPRFDFQRSSSFRPQTEVLLKKEFWQFFREPSQWLHLLVMFFLIVVFVGSVATIHLKTTNPLHQSVSYLVTMSFNGFLIASIALRFVFPAMSLEGQSFWSIRSAPIRLRKIYTLKFFPLFACVLLVAELLSFFSNYSLHEQTQLFLVTAGGSLSLSIGLVALNLGAGSYFANYREKSAIRVASSHGASVTFLLSLGFLTFLLLVLFLLLPFRHLLSQTVILGRVYSEIPLSLALSIMFGISILIAGIASYLGLRSLERDF